MAQVPTQNTEGVRKRPEGGQHRDGSGGTGRQPKQTNKQTNKQVNNVGDNSHIVTPTFCESKDIKKSIFYLLRRWTKS